MPNMMAAQATAVRRSGTDISAWVKNRMPQKPETSRTTPQMATTRTPSSVANVRTPAYLLSRSSSALQTQIEPAKNSKSGATSSRMPSISP